MGKEKLTTPEKAMIIASTMFNKHDYICVHRSLYRYDGKIWAKIEKGEDSSIINKFWCSEYHAASKSAKEETFGMLEDRTWSEYPDQIKAMGKPGNLINLKSTRYNIVTNKKSLYTKEAFCMWNLPYDLPDPEDKTQPVHFIKYCKDVFYDEKLGKEDYQKTIRLVAEWIGYCLLPGNPFQVALMLVGEGQNGKGKLMEVVEGIVGEENCSTLDIKDINEQKALWTTKNKLINFCGDADSNEKLDSSIMKRVTEGASVTMNQKFKDEVKATFTAKLMMGANKIPFSSNVGFSVERRYIMLPMTREFTTEERDPDLGLKMIPEYPYILRAAIKQLPGLLERKRFDIPKRAKDMYASYRMANDSVRMWIEDEQKKGDEGDYIRSTDAKKEYNEYCKESNLRACGPHELYRKLGILGYEKVTRNGYHFFKGMKKPVNAPQTY